MRIEQRVRGLKICWLNVEKEKFLIIRQMKQNTVSKQEYACWISTDQICKGSVCFRKPKCLVQLEHMTENKQSLTKEQKILYNSLIKEAQPLSKSDDFLDRKQALFLFQKAYSLYSGNEKLNQKIKTLEACVVLLVFRLPKTL